MSGRGAERVLHVIEWMAGRTSPVSLTDVVKSLNLPKSSALGLIRILGEAGYIERLEDGRYKLIRLPGEPTSTGRGWGSLLRHAEKPLREAVEQTGESGFIGVLGEDRGIRYIAKVLPAREIRYDRDILVPRRAHQVSSGIVLLSEFSPEELNDYIATEHKAGRLDNGDELRAQIKQASVSGLQVNRKGVVEGAGGMAAPIRNRDGRIIAALNIAGPARRLGEAIDDIEPVLREAADTISASLGWDGRTKAIPRNQTN